MKRQSITLTALLIMSSGLYAATMTEITNELTSASGQFGIGALNPTLPTASQNASLVKWDETFSRAKTFVMDNSKNLVGLKDSDITNAMAAVEKANMDFINAIKISRGISNADGLDKQISLLTTIKNNIMNATRKLSLTNMTLSNKKNAQTIVLSIGRFLEQQIDKIKKDLIEKADSIRNRLPAAPTRVIS